ncbi:methyltransferase domain-containing protein [Oscillatoria sp. FACHB-1407]|uniref:class I SAM-dependent methyltransferase n=1 Tax=Oscillatoria sp. FACHB-1407 TaxID=2692847 RepID=UPI00168309EC|nr:methyltransferase domain-containing protein [Oscillatoria sp. FACHB-1407]MBD2464151.1 methyltransferase domain-containing protein [Oscillatoria sp. FACHB-1407]
MTQQVESQIEATVRQQYNQLAKRYDRRWRQYINNTLIFFKDWMRLAPDAIALDIACGTGELERLLLTQNPHQPITGIDISNEMLIQAHQKLSRFPNVTFQVATARSLPFQDHQFDAVFSANAFHYFDQPNLALREMQRVLKPDGRLLLLDWCRDSWTCQLCDRVLQWLDPAHKQCYTQAELHHLLTSNQFHIVRSQKVRFGLIWELMAVEAVIG